VQVVKQSSILVYGLAIAHLHIQSQVHKCSEIFIELGFLIS
jgi:hypothetical protein